MFYIKFNCSSSIGPGTKDVRSLALLIFHTLFPLQGVSVQTVKKIKTISETIVAQRLTIKTTVVAAIPTWG